MGSKWTVTPNATERVKTLLGYAGIPLEIQVREICANFIKETVSSELDMSSEQLVYSPSDSDNDYREIDRLVSIHEYIDIGTTAVSSVTVNIPIECKFRKDLEVFAFPSLEENVHTRFPLCGDFRRSQLARLIAETTQALKHIEPSILSLVEIKDGETPQRVHEENLIYNAGGALYDFMTSDIPTFVDTEVAEYDDILDDLKIFTKFDAEVGSKISNWYDFFDRWTAKLTDDIIESFRKKYKRNEGKFYLSIHSHLPVVCLNTPIYRVEISNSLEISSFNEIPFCLTTIRKRGWPGELRSVLISHRPEVPVIVTNPNNLRSVLHLGYTWFNAIKSTLQSAPEPIVARFALEAGLYSKALRAYKDRNNEYLLKKPGPTGQAGDQTVAHVRVY